VLTLAGPKLGKEWELPCKEWELPWRIAVERASGERGLHQDFGTPQRRKRCLGRA